MTEVGDLIGRGLLEEVPSDHETALVWVRLPSDTWLRLVRSLTLIETAPTRSPTTQPAKPWRR